MMRGKVAVLVMALAIALMGVNGYAMPIHFEDDPLHIEAVVVNDVKEVMPAEVPEEVPEEATEEEVELAVEQAEEAAPEAVEEPEEEKIDLSVILEGFAALKADNEAIKADNEALRNQVTELTTKLAAKDAEEKDFMDKFKTLTVKLSGNKAPEVKHSIGMTNGIGEL